jgi:hypothetical protein
VVLVQKKKIKRQRTWDKLPVWIKKTPDSSRGHKISTRDGSVIGSDLTYKFEKLDRSSQEVFVSKNQTKTTRARARFTLAIFPLSQLPTPQDYQPHPLVPSLAASTSTFGALSWRYRELKFKFLNWVTTVFFSQLFRQFRILNCNLSDSLKNLPTLFQKWFEYFHQNKS